MGEDWKFDDEELLSSLKYIMSQRGKFSCHSGRICHAAGVELHAYLNSQGTIKEVLKRAVDKSGINYGLSKLTNSNSLISKKLLG